jgi:alkanesulfonate monooxygenase SsuD/methylene tetrahydromethanopterin reductase-like flavin-dependent oxidoreductase (luciferase family)
MTRIGYAAMLEQFHPTELLDWCAQAEEAGFEAGFMVSEHFHPWLPQQGQSAFAWSFMGALGTRTSLPFGVGVTCPGFRYHPAVIAPRRGDPRGDVPRPLLAGTRGRRGAQRARRRRIWPEIGVRSAMMFEAIEIMSKLFSGEVVKHQGKYFTLESAKLYTRPDEPVPIYVATAGPFNAKRTGKFADGMITVGAADEKIVMLWDKFDEGAREAGKDPIGKPKVLQLHVSWARNDRDAIHNALVEWPNGGMPFPSRTSGTRRTLPRWQRWSSRRTSQTVS